MNQATPLKIILALLALAAALGTGGPGAVAQSPANPIELARQLNRAFVDVAEKVSPAVVVIRVAHDPSSVEVDADSLEMMPKEFRRWLEQHREKQRKEPESGKEENSPQEPVWDGQGSGVVIREEGYILTNRHVVEGARKIKVRFRDQTEYDGEVRGVDAQSDIAVIKIDPQGRKLVAAKLGDSDKTRVGEFAIAIGAPFDLDYTVTFGHVSAKGRSRILNDPTMDQDFIQTDANINPGNSGGPLVNIEGDIMGINTLIRGMRTGIGFAIPANLAREVSDRLIAEGKFVRAYLGVKIRSLREDAEFREQLPGIEDGVVVQEIPKGGPAARSELKAGDVIVAVDGSPVNSPQQLKNELRSKPIGEPLTLEVHRFGQNLKVKIKPEPFPESAPVVAVAKHSTPPEERTSDLGLTVEGKSKSLLKEYGLENEKVEGVIVTEVATGSDAEQKGLKAGDIITEVNQKRVSSPKQFLDAVKTANAKKGVSIQYISEGSRKIVFLKAGGD